VKRARTPSGPDAPDLFSSAGEGAGREPAKHDRGSTLSKSRFVAGWQCHKLLWLKTWEPEAEELKISPAIKDIIDQGNQVGRLARARFPGGELVELAHDNPERFAHTRKLMAQGAPAVFEAWLQAGHTYAAVDVLLRENDGWVLIEVKSGSEVKDKYVMDAAIQTYIATQAGVDVRRTEIMHINKEYLAPAPGETAADLFVREDVSFLVSGLLPHIPAQIEAQLAALAGPLPDVPIGRHCREPDECPFMKGTRCWPAARDSVLKIQGLLYEKRFALYHGGTRSIAELPRTYKLNDVQTRQRRAVETGKLVVEYNLAEELEPYEGRLGFLDFESVGRAVPVWSGTKPWEQIGVQFSYHEGPAGGPYTHAEFLAEPDTDPREAIARRLVEVTRDADRVLMYTSFEKTQIRSMQRFNPHLAEDLGGLEAKLLDLAQVVRHTVYHKDFGGSLSIKEVLPVLVPGMSYKDTVRIHDGSEASAKLARLLFYAGELTPAERAELKEELLAYCKQDTFAMVKLLERLKALVGGL
jgi:hypothetical protein